MPPLFYIFRYINADKVVVKPWFGAQKTIKMWFYTLTLVNGTQDAVGNVDISVTNKAKCDSVAVMPFDDCFRIEPKEYLSTKTFTACKMNEGKFVVQLDSFKAKATTSLFIIIQSQFRPSIDDIEVNVRNDSEVFAQVTPTQLERAATKGKAITVKSMDK